MKTKIVILTPVYNDWKNLGKLLRKINEIFKRKINFKFDLIIVIVQKKNLIQKNKKLELLIRLQ